LGWIFIHSVHNQIAFVVQFLPIDNRPQPSDFSLTKCIFAAPRKAKEESKGRVRAWPLAVPPNRKELTSAPRGATAIDGYSRLGDSPIKKAALKPLP
jgi:hypothetical protein